jgi:GntR family transcriptional repressor for pyruvate dehydrogenase complex
VDELQKLHTGEAMTSVQVPSARSYEPVVDAILKGIHFGEFRPGERLATERELAVQFRVSRGVIREALTVLAALGLVESRQGSGTFVTNNTVPSISRSLILTARPEAESLVGLAEIRVPLEKLAAELAAVRRNDLQAEAIAKFAYETRIAFERDDWDQFGRYDISFHEAIGKSACNPLLEAMVLTMHDVMSSAVALVIDRTGRMEVAADHHMRIAEAITRRDSEQAGQLMVSHITYSVSELLAALTAVSVSESTGHGWGPLTVSRLLKRSSRFQLAE